jgi:hypothetical protein
VQPQGGGEFPTPPRQAPSEAFPFNQAWRDNVVKNTGEAGDTAIAAGRGAVNNISDWFSSMWGKATDRGDQNLTEDLIGKGIPAAASAVYNTGKGIYDQATDPMNMRGAFKGKVMAHQMRPDEPLRDVTQEGLRGMETPSPQMPDKLEEVSQSIGWDADKFKAWENQPGNFGKDKGWMNPVTGMGQYDAETIAARDESNPNWRRQVAAQSRFDKDYADQMAQPGEVSPIQALGAKMTMGAKDVGGAIADAPRAVAGMAGKGVGGVLGYGKSLFENFGQGFREGAAKQRGEAPQAQSPGTQEPQGKSSSAKKAGGFKGAFASAKKSGKKEFSYKGKKYNTRVKGQKKEKDKTFTNADGSKVRESYNPKTGTYQPVNKRKKRSTYWGG